MTEWTKAGKIDTVWTELRKQRELGLLIRSFYSWRIGNKIYQNIALSTVGA